MDVLIFTKIAKKLQQARRVLFITGAGISADSGLPTYRGIGGLYNNKLTDDNITIEAALSGSMLHHNPSITWKYIQQIEAACVSAQCNPAHYIIAKFQEYLDVCVLTQNIDGLHRNAGSRNLIEIHGNIHEIRCVSCALIVTVPDYSMITWPPLCSNCQTMMRPNVVLFGEMLPQTAVLQLETELSKGFDVVFSIGTTSIFPYIAGPLIQASHTGNTTIEINPNETQVSCYVNYKLRTNASPSMSAIWDAYQLLL